MQSILMVFMALSVMLGACAPDNSNASQSPSTGTVATAPASAPATTASSASLPGKGKMAGEPIQVPYITWGGDYPTFWCAGGDQTREDTICAQYGVNVKLVNGDSTDQQLADYKAGKSPFLRGTFEQIAVHTAELCAQGPGACPQFVFQMTWSAGDHLVTREAIKDLKELKGKTVALQKGGPHLGFLYAILKDAGLNWSDVKIVFVDNLSGTSSPAEAIEKNPSVDGAFVITPDMLALTGAESTVKGAHVLVSTTERRRSIPDAYFVRADWAQAHPDELRNFAAAYLTSMEAVKGLQEAYDGSGSEEYKALVLYADQTFEALPTFEDADGLYRDATFVGHAGTVAFTDRANTEGITGFVASSNAIARELGLASQPFEVQVASIDWSHAVFAGLKTRSLQHQVSFNPEATRAQLEQMTASGTIGASKSLSYSASYEPNQTQFDPAKYGTQFDELLKLMGSYSTTPMAIRCHADTLLAVGAMLRSGMQAGEITRQGTPGNWSYFADGAPLDTRNAQKIGSMLHEPRFNKLPEGENPSEIATAAKTLTEERCRNARTSFLDYARAKGSKVPDDHIVAQGVGIAEPVVVLPRSESETAANRRVEFAIVRTQVEAVNPSFDY